jgi:hypothetical protein
MIKLLTIPFSGIEEGSRKYMRFILDGIIYEFRALVT